MHLIDIINNYSSNIVENVLWPDLLTFQYCMQYIHQKIYQFEVTMLRFTINMPRERRWSKYDRAR